MPVRPSAKKSPLIPLAAKPAARTRPTAAEFMKIKWFLGKCKEMGVEPTKRQARKALARVGRWA